MVSSSRCVADCVFLIEVTIEKHTSPSPSKHTNIFAKCQLRVSVVNVSIMVQSLPHPVEAKATSYSQRDHWTIYFE